MSDLSHLRCFDCAFTAGTDASKCDIARIQARLCAESGEPFFCHVNEESLCAGYIDAAIKLRDKGFQEKEPEWKQEVRKGLLDVINMAAHGEIDLTGDELPIVSHKIIGRRLAAMEKK